MRVLLCLILVLPTFFSARSQQSDTLKVLQLNLLNYRNNTGNCNTTTNNPADKEENLRLIVRALDPDILAFNEMGRNSSNIGPLLTNALNTDGVTKYAPTFFAGTGSLMNHLYYNTEKLGFIGHDDITRALDNSSLVRSIDAYTLYYREPGLDASDDTTYLTVFVAHLKAGNSTSDREDRDLATAALMDYIANEPVARNYVLAGDLNIYDASEAGFSNLVNYSVDSLRFQDPANRIGEWDNNSSFSRDHTQSTRTTSTNGGCFSGGGFDNRFDFILASRTIIDGLDFMEYLPGTYQAYGQDGIRFNGSMLAPTNPTLPSGIQQALYELSDHLPVIMDIEVTSRNPSSVAERSDVQEWRMVQPIQNNTLEITHSGNGLLKVEVIDLLGKTLFVRNLNPGTHRLSLPSDMPHGIYLIKGTNNQLVTHVNKAIKI